MLLSRPVNHTVDYRQTGMECQPAPPFPSFVKGSMILSSARGLQLNFPLGERKSAGAFLAQNKVWLECPGVTFITTKPNINGKLLQATPHICNELENISPRDMLTL